MTGAEDVAHGKEAERWGELLTSRWSPARGHIVTDLNGVAHVGEARAHHRIHGERTTGGQYYSWCSGYDCGWGSDSYLTKAQALEAGDRHLSDPESEDG